MEAVATYFDDPFRLPAQEIAVQKRTLELHPQARAILDALPHPCAVTNQWRQIIAVNRRLDSWLAMDDVEKIVGLRLGEALACERAHEGPGGCGTGRACAHCGAANALLESRTSHALVERECRLTIKGGGGSWECLDLRVTAAPVELGLNFPVTLVTISDISHEKRRRVLERVFLHDVANTVGALGGMLKYADRLNYREDEEFFRRARRLSIQLSSEIEEHRDLLAAETNELQVRFTPVSSLELLTDVAASFEAGMFGKGRLEIDPGSVNRTINTDPTLLARVLGNLLKNAFEASSPDELVRAGCTFDERGMRFWVQNQAVMSPEVQMQIFQRAFSTKGRDRGVGTYSVKLLGERYLRGKVSFESTPQSGTVFSLTLPA